MASVTPSDPNSLRKHTLAVIQSNHFVRVKKSGKQFEEKSRQKSKTTLELYLTCPKTKHKYFEVHILDDIS